MLNLKIIEVTEQEERIIIVMRDAAKIQGEGKICPEISVTNGKLDAPDSAKMLDDLRMSSRRAEW